MNFNTIGLTGLTALSQLASLATGAVGGTVNPPSANFATQPAVVEMRGYTVSELIKESSAHYGVDGTAALEIARCESRLQQYHPDGSLVRGRKNRSDVGVFQINEKYHLEQSRTVGFDIYTAEGNIGYAMWLMARDGDRPWHWSEKCWGV
ncbi:MAG: hypothetical protein AAB415_00880 [Patescibacteria group bacterium]